MNVFWFLFNEFLYRPIFNILMFFLGTFEGNLGLAIICLTLLVRFLLMMKVGSPHDMQKNMWSFQEETQKIQEKYKDDPEKMWKELMSAMKKKWGWPLKGCLGMLIQIPVMLGLFGVIQTISSRLAGLSGDAVRIGFEESFSQQIYSFLYTFAQPFIGETADAIQNIQQVFLGMDLLVAGNITLTVLASVLMYFNMKMMNAMRPMTTPKIPGANVPDMSKMMWFMNIFIVIMMAFFVFNVAAWVGLYIVTTTVFSIGQFLWQQRAVLWAKYQAWKNKGQGVVVKAKG